MYREVLAFEDAPPSVLWHAHHGLALIAVAQNQPARAAQEFEAALDVIEKTRAGLLRDDYKLSYLTELIDFYRVYVRALVDARQRSSVRSKSPTRAGAAFLPNASVPRRRGARQWRTSAVLPPRRMWRSFRYWLTPSASLLWVVTADGVHQFTLPPATEIDALVRDHQTAIANALVDPLASRESAGDRLYQGS